MAAEVDRAPFAEEVAAVLAATRPGDVLTYGEVAAQAGRPGAARAVGRVLASDAGDGDAGDGRDLPWWRVVTAAGRLVPGFEAEHAARLRAEGVTVAAGRVVGSARTGAAGRSRR